MTKEMEEQVVRGRTTNIPAAPSDVVKIYLASSSPDTMVERTYLMKHAYPRLRQYCREKYASYFQIVDMKWGLADAEVDNYESFALCLQQIHLCRKQSIGPNFVLLLGQKYGQPILQNQVSNRTMETLCEALQPEEANFVKLHYKLDENAMPAAYALQLDQDVSDDQRVKTETKLKTTLKEAARKAVSTNALDPQEAKRFCDSGLEREVEEGLMNNLDPAKSCLVFTRHFPNINLGHRNAHKYVDIAKEKLDAAAQKQLLNLLEFKILAKLPNSNVFQYTDLDWSNSKHGGVNEVEHRDYLEDFAADFVSAVQMLIDDALKTRKTPPPTDPLYLECLAHAELVTSRCEDCCGRDNELKAIKSYINDQKGSGALMLCGPLGCGKSTLIAKASAMLFKEWHHNLEKTHQIVRFAGSTAVTSSITCLLENLIEHLLVLLGPEVSHYSAESHDDFEWLAYTFDRLLSEVPRNRKLVLFLDGIDEMEDSKEAFTKTWIPSRLPANVKVIVSLNDEGKVPVQLQSFCNILQVNLMGPLATEERLSKWLTSINRTISSRQWKHLKKSLGNKPHSPLYLRLLFNQMKRWTSFNTELPKMGDSAVSCMTKLVESVEAKYGRTLVTHSVLFIELTKHGIAHTEMEDVLSLDEQVMDEVFEHHMPPLRRLPPALWIKIANDLTYLTHKNADHTNVFGWSHRLMRKVIQSRYNPTFPTTQDFKSKCQTTDAIVEILAEYFSSKWADVAKPFQFSKKQLKRTGLLNPFSEATRLVPKQPTTFLSLAADGSIITHFNHRKLSVLLDAYMTLIRSNMEGALELLTDFTRNVIFDYDMIYALLKSGQHRILVQVQELCAIAIPPHCEQELMRRELFLFSEYIIQDIDYLKSNPDCFGSFLISQCLDFYGLLPHLTLFIDSVDSAGRDLCALIPTSQHTETCVSRAQCRIIEHSGPVRGAVCTEMCIYSLSKRLIAARYELSGYTTVYNKVLHPPPADYFRLIVGAKGRWDASFEAESDNMESIILYLVLAYRPHIYVIKGSTGQQLRVLKCEVLCPDVSSDTGDSQSCEIDHVHAIGSQDSASHLLCVSFNSGVTLIIHSQTKAILWKSKRADVLISNIDIGYFKGTHIFGLSESTGHISWLCWNNLQEDISSQTHSLQPILQPTALPKHGEEQFSNADVIVENFEMRSDYMTDASARDDRGDVNANAKGHHSGFSEIVHVIACTHQGALLLVTDVINITYGPRANSVTVENHAAASKTITLSLPFQEPIKSMSGKVALSNSSVKNILVACSTARNAHLVMFDRTQQHATITHSFEKTFDRVLLRNGLLIGTFGSSLDLFNVTEHEVIDSLVVQRLVELDEQRGELTHVYASSTTGIMLVACSEYNTMSVYLTHLLNVHSGDAYSSLLRTNTKHKIAQTPITALTCSSRSAYSLSQDARDVVIWDLQDSLIKNEIHVKEEIEQCCLSVTETHVAMATVSGRILLYTVEHDDDLPVVPIKQFHLQHGSSCWLVPLHSQPHIICVISKVGLVSTINVHTLHVHTLQDSKLPQGIDSILTRNHDIYVIAHKWRSFLGIEPSTGVISWELDMNQASGKSLQKFGRRIVNLCEFNGDVYMVLTGSPQNITSTQDSFTLLCIKPSANSIFKILDLTLPKTTQVICAAGASSHMLLHHESQVQLIDLTQGVSTMKLDLQLPCITSDGAYICGVTQKRNIKLYRALDKRCIATYRMRVDVEAIDISTDDEYVVVACSNRSIYSFVIADPYNQEHSLAIKKLPSRNRPIASDLACAKEDSRFDLLHQITKILDSSGYVSEAVSSLDSAYEHASRVYSVSGESRTTHERIKGDDLLARVFGNKVKDAANDSNESTSTLVNKSDKEGSAAETPVDSTASINDDVEQSLESVDIPVAVSSSTKTDSPTKQDGVTSNAGPEPVQPHEDLHIDLSQVEVTSVLKSDLLTTNRSTNKDETKSTKTTHTYKSGEVVQAANAKKLQPQIENHTAENIAVDPVATFEGITPLKPFVLSYKSAVLQQSTQERLQRIKNQFVEVGMESDLESSLNASATEHGLKSSTRSGRVGSTHKGEVVGTYRRRSRSRSKSPKSSTRLNDNNNKTSRACLIS